MTAPNQLPAEAVKIDSRHDGAPSNARPSRGALPSCGKCGAEWTGIRACHCAGCHITFAGLRAFDRHRRGSKCTDPNALGMVVNDRGLWGEPSDGIEWWKSA